MRRINEKESCTKKTFDAPLIEKRIENEDYLEDVENLRKIW